MPDPITAIGGNVTIDAEVASVRKATISKRADNQKYATSDTLGWKKSAEGMKDWDASVDIYLEDGAFPSFTVGAVVACTFQTAAGQTESGSGRIDSIENIEADIENSGMVACTINISGNGALS